MGRYVSYLLDLAGEGDVRTMKGSVRFVPDPDKALIPKTAFVWKIVVSEEGDVWVRGLHVGSYKLIASARWQTTDQQVGSTSGLVEQRQLDIKNPTGFQWNLIEDSVRDVLAHAERAYKQGSTYGPMSADKIERPTGKELDGLIAATEANAEMQKNLRLDRAADADARKTATRSRQGLVIGFSISAVVIAAVAVPIVCVVHRRGEDMVAVPTLPNGEHVPIAIDAAIDTPPSPDAPIDASPDDAVMSADSLASAIALSRSAFTWTTANVSPAALRLAHFNHLLWADVDVADETTLPLIVKDAEPEFGKHLCVRGTIRGISRYDLEQPPRATKKVFVGLVDISARDSISFVALGSTSPLVRDDKARFCGVVTGSIGATPELVGMFDLPETRHPQAEQ
ncbi:MAG TPA: hypothetical protein VGM39_01630 [Kofleriaceae bacterium]|jgi:hypothetical protein